MTNQNGKVTCPLSRSSVWIDGPNLNDIGSRLADVEFGMGCKVGVTCDGKVLSLVSVFGGGLGEKIESPDWLANVDNMPSPIGKVGGWRQMESIYEGVHN